ncbi:hypothetical protein QVD17_15009 [Tagetes erecta]|uniref:Uncharacterized protein n=1 Tax=Tagetes erecta TaxID=13708 RepID=A0AAD8KRL3_TARER|nr:hypothetical protein QVD17_15009 [Tagetes erecta]
MLQKSQPLLFLSNTTHCLTLSLKQEQIWITKSLKLHPLHQLSVLFTQFLTFNPCIIFNSLSSILCTLGFVWFIECRVF